MCDVEASAKLWSPLVDDPHQLGSWNTKNPCRSTANSPYIERRTDGSASVTVNRSRLVLRGEDEMTFTHGRHALADVDTACAEAPALAGLKTSWGSYEVDLLVYPGARPPPGTLAPVLYPDLSGIESPGNQQSGDVGIAGLLRAPPPCDLHAGPASQSD